MSLDKLSNEELIADVKILVQDERRLLTQVLRHLLEIETRQLHLARGFSSLFDFCCEELKYSRAEAHIRIQAMRLMKSVPEVEEKVTCGELSLSVMAQAQSAFRRTEKKRAVSKSEKREILAELTGVSTREAERKLATHYPETAPKEKTRALSDELTLIEFSASRGLMEKLERLKGLLAHKNFSGRYDVLFEELADMALKKLSKDDAAVLSACELKTDTSKRTRYIPRATQRLIWTKARSRCEYVDPLTNRRCSSQHGLQIDHRHEFARGGGREPANLRLLCGAHNRYLARLQA